MSSVSYFDFNPVHTIVFDGKMHFSVTAVHEYLNMGRDRSVEIIKSRVGNSPMLATKRGDEHLLLALYSAAEVRTMLAVKSALRKDILDNRQNTDEQLLASFDNYHMLKPCAIHDAHTIAVMRIYPGTVVRFIDEQKVDAHIEDECLFVIRATRPAVALRCFQPPSADTVSINTFPSAAAVSRYRIYQYISIGGRRRSSLGSIAKIIARSQD